MNLKQKTVENTFIVFAVTFFNRGINILSKIILARLLFPEDFGLVAIASIIINAIALFREVGIESALIYRKEKVEEAADTAFIILPFIGVGLYLIAYFIAPYVGEFYNESVVVDITRISGITLILTSLNSVPVTIFAKELEFKKAMAPEVISNITYTIVTILLALRGLGVWSLVYGGLIGGFAGLIVVWLMTSYKPKIRFNKSLASEMIGYGKYVLGAQIVIFVLVNIDSAVVGKMLDVKMLGYYAMASSIANLPATNITHILGRILFPTYSVLQDDKKRFGEVFLKIVEYISFLTIPASFALFIFAPELVTYVIGKRWMPIIPALRILCVGALLRSITATTGDVFKAIGRPKLLQDISLVQLILMVVLIVPAIHYGGIIGVSVLVTLKSFLAFTLSMYVVAVNVRLSVKDIYNPMRTQFFSSIISAAVVFFVGRILPPTMPSLILSISLFGLLYILLFCLINRKIFYEFRELLKCILPNPR